MSLRTKEMEALFVDKTAPERDEFRKLKPEGKRYTWVAHYQPTWESLERAWGDPLADETPEDRLWEGRDSGAVLRNRHGDAIIDYKSANSDGRAQALVEGLVEWSRRHHLDEVWCRAYAYYTLDLWCHNEDWREARLLAQEPFDLPWWLHPVPTVKGEIVGKFIFEYLTLYPGKGFRQEVKDEITEAFSEQLDKFLDERERAAELGGLVRTPYKTALPHFEWLALHQVRAPPMTSGQIFARYKDQTKFEDLPHVSNPRAIQTAIQKLADEIGLEQRYGGRGRKPKSPAKQH